TGVARGASATRGSGAASISGGARATGGARAPGGAGASSRPRRAGRRRGAVRASATVAEEKDEQNRRAFHREADPHARLCPRVSRTVEHRMWRSGLAVMRRRPTFQPMNAKLMRILGLGVVVTAGCGGGAALQNEARALTVDPAASGIDHVVVVMMENRSFDHLLRWLDGADGRQAGLRYPDRNGQLQKTQPLAPDFQGCAHPDPDHSFAGGRVEFDGGACDGWLRAGMKDNYATGYYRKRDRPFF